MMSCIRYQKHLVGLSLSILLSSCNPGQNGGATPPPASDVINTKTSSRLAQARTAEIHKKLMNEQKPALEKRFVFAERLSLAHLRSNGLLIDFGTLARHKYTLADWRSGYQGDFVENDNTFTYVTRSQAHLFFLAFEEEAGGGSIAIRAKAVGAQKARIYLNGDYVGTIELGKEFSHGMVRFDHGIRPGRNEIRIRTNGKANTKEGIRAALALDYVRITPTVGKGGPAASSFDTPKIRNAASNRSDILLTAGETLTYYLPIPNGGQLNGSVWRRADKKNATLSISIRKDKGNKPIEIEEEIGEKEFHLNVDLKDFEGAVAEVSFRAMSGSLVLHDAALLGLPFGGESSPGKVSAKNFVLVLIDTLRADKLEAYNSDTRVRTAYLSQLAKSSTVFERAFAPENWTKPSVASMLTGLYPSTHNTKGDRDTLPTTATMMQEHFKSLGFVTAGFVANGYVSGKFGFERAWDTWTNYVREGKPNRAQFVVEDAVNWLEQRTDDKPFFLYVHTIDPHVPYIPPKKYFKMYDVGKYRGPVEAKTTAKLAEQIKTGRVKLNDRDKMRFEALYDGEITYHDDQLVKLEAKLKELGLLENTLMVVTSDHGEEFFDHGSAGHGHSMYEELLHVPLIIRLPGNQKSAGKAKFRDPNETSLVDIFPTACDILGIECPSEVEGYSLLDRMTHKSAAPYPSVAFSEFLTGGVTIRMGRYKLIYRGFRTTLFDLKRDPNETADLTDMLPLTFNALRDNLGLHLGRFVDSPPAKDTRIPKKSKHTPKKAVIDKETEKQLKALGYLGGE